VQIKNRNGAVWDNLFPKTKAELVTTTTDLQFVSATEKSTWNGKQAALGYTPENPANKGVANGYAGLDAGGKVPSAQLPSYVDDVKEYVNLAGFPVTGEEGKIYVAQDTNKTYRWSGSAYTVISETLAIGETSSTAYRGDRGKTAYDHSQSAHAPSDAQKNSNILKSEIEGVLIGEISSHTHAAAAPASHGSTHVEGGTDVIPTAIAGTKSGLMSKADKTKLDGIADNANNYSHPTTAGNKHIPSGGATGQLLKYSASGEAQWSSAILVAADEPASPLSNDMWYQIIA